MAGPVAGLLLREPLLASELSELDTWIHQISEGIHFHKAGEQERYSLGFSLINLPPLITNQKGRSCTFLLDLLDPEKNEDVSFEEQVKEALQANLGYIPKELILVSAMCNQKIDHQLLAQLLIELADRFDANMIDLFGNIQNRPDLPGIVLEIETGSQFVSLMVSVEFLKAWLNHPDFRMIK